MMSRMRFNYAGTRHREEYYKQKNATEKKIMITLSWATWTN